MNCGNEKTDRLLLCPSCQKPGSWLPEKSAPFCSNRCRLVDLGKWFNEEHAVSAPLPDEGPENHAP